MARNNSLGFKSLKGEGGTRVLRRRVFFVIRIKKEREFRYYLKPGFTKQVPGFLLDRGDSVADDNNCTKVQKEV